MVKGEVANDDEFAIKTVLELMNLLANMGTIRKDATELALKFLLTNSTTRKTILTRPAVLGKGLGLQLGMKRRGKDLGGLRIARK